MSNPYFQFKQFKVEHDRCAMKVGTDGVLLGAWAEVTDARRVLDIGTGTGLIALMVAQRTRDARIEGIDVDEAAVEQAEENVAASPWKDRILIRKEDIRQTQETGYDVIVSNPPYFEEQVTCPDERRNTARHAGELGFDELLDAVCRLLTADGIFSVVLPTGAYDRFVALAAVRHLYIRRCTWVFTKPTAKPKRVLLAFGRTICPWQEEHLYIMENPPAYSGAYKALTGDFYLNI